MIVSSSHSIERSRDEVVRVVTPLEAIMRLEGTPRIQRIILSGTYAAHDELHSFLVAMYPTVRIDREP